MAFDASAFIGRSVKEMDAALKAHQAAARDGGASKTGVPNVAMEAALASLADEAAESTVRRNAALKIGSMRSDARAADVLRVVEQLANPHNCDVGGGQMSIRRAALLAFTELANGPETPVVVASCAAVTALMGHDDPDAREMAVRAMGALGMHADVVAVAALLEDEDDVRSAASDTLVALRDHLGGKGLEAIALRLRFETDDEVRGWALRTLAGLGPSAASMAGAVAACLEDEGTMELCPPSKALALTALAAFGEPSAAAYLPAIAALLVDPCQEACVRAAAIEALGRVGRPDEHAEVITEFLYDSDRSLRGAAAIALKRWDLA